MPLGIVSEEDFLSEINGKVESHKLNDSLIRESENGRAAEHSIISESPAPSSEHPSSSQSSNLESNITVTEIKHGRGNVDNVPQIIRDMAAEASLSGIRANEISQQLNISPSSISAYKHGVTSTARYRGEKNAQLEKVRNRVSSRAANRLNDALKALANKDLNAEKATDISSIAKDMAAVFDKISPSKQNERENEKQVHLHLYAPKMKSVEDYEIIDV